MAPIDKSLQDDIGEKQQQFLDLLGEIRPKLHRYCTRMSGSILDGEDLVQDVLAHAFFKLSGLQDISRLEPWLFRIAYTKSIDFLRRGKGIVMEYDDENHETASEPEQEIGLNVGDALSSLVSQLPPKERACVLLKEVLGYTLEDCADIVQSTLGGVKSALHRARRKLERAATDTAPVVLAPEERNLVQLYLDRFNGQDWTGVLELVRADAQLDLMGHSGGNARDFMQEGYFRNYGGFPWEWKFELCLVDGRELPVLFRRESDHWVPHGALKLSFEDGKVAHIQDYFHIEYLFEHATVEVP